MEALTHSPLYISIALAYYAHPTNVHNGSPAALDAERCMASDGLIKEISKGVYRITLKGRAYVEALKRVPLPRTAYIIEWPSDGEVQI